MKSPASRPSTGRVFFSRYCTVRPLSIIAAALSKAMPSGSLQTVLAGITRAWLYEPGGLLA